MKDQERESHLKREEDFYAKCSEILNIDHEYKRPVPRRTRWNTRFLGNGRFHGFGLIRRFSSNAIHVIRKNGEARLFDNESDVYVFLKNI